MAEVLSQSQIDELLNSMNNGGDIEKKEDKKKASDEHKKYDFSSPKKFTKDRLRLLKGIYDNYARLVALRLNGLLRSVCEIEVYSVEEQRYLEFNNMLSESDVITLLDINIPDEPKGLPMLFHVSPNIMVNMMDRMLGGQGDDTGVDLSYEYTEIELALYEKLMSFVLGVTETAWSNYVDFTMGQQHLEPNPAMMQNISVDEPVVIVLLNFKMNEIEGNVTICVPGSLMTDIFSRIEKMKHVDGVVDTTILNNREKIMYSLNKSALEIKAKVGAAQLSVEDIYSLNVGDVIDLNIPKESDVTLYIEEQPWFTGRIGVYNKNTAIEIQSYVKEDTEEVAELETEEI